MSKFIELTSPTSSIVKWAINIEHIVQVRRVSNDDECQISLISGQITPAEPYGLVMSKLKMYGGMIV